MVLYPILFKALGYSELQTGFLIGATIHDVAQVVGAGYSVSDEAGLIATLVKMLRVACLPSLVFGVHLIFRDNEQSGSHVPWFLVLFVALAVIRSLVVIPEPVIAIVAETSRWMLVTAIAALGLQTNLKQVLRVHPALLIILFIETIFILGLAMIFASKYLS